MRTLYLLRHAKSSWKHSELDDHERPLKKRGIRDACRMGKLFHELQIVPEAVRCSTSARTRATLEGLELDLPADVETEFTDRLYECSADDVLAVASTLPDEAGAALLIGHNPAIEDVIANLTGERVRIPTGTLVRAQFAVDHWPQLRSHPAIQSIEVWRPKELQC